MNNSQEQLEAAIKTVRKFIHQNYKPTRVRKDGFIHTRFSIGKLIDRKFYEPNPEIRDWHPELRDLIASLGLSFEVKPSTMKRSYPNACIRFFFAD